MLCLLLLLYIYTCAQVAQKKGGGGTSVRSRENSKVEDVNDYRKKNCIFWFNNRRSDGSRFPVVSKSLTHVEVDNKHLYPSVTLPSLFYNFKMIHTCYLLCTKCY